MRHYLSLNLHIVNLIYQLAKFSKVNYCNFSSCQLNFRFRVEDNEDHFFIGNLIAQMKFVITGKGSIVDKTV